MAQQPTRALRLGHGPVQRSMVSNDQAVKMRTNGIYTIEDNRVTIGTFVPNNWGYIDIPVGRFTYRQWGFSITAPSAIAGVTTLQNGKHIVNTSKIADYIDTFIIEINGQAKWEMNTTDLVKWNAYQNLDTTDGTLRFAFGAPMQHDTDMVEDAYQFGTGNLKSVKLRVKTRTTWVNGMLPVMTVEYAKVSRPIGYFVTTTRYSYTNAGAGKFAITDLAVGKDFSTIWVQGASIDRAILDVDREEVFDCSTYNLRAIHESFGRDVAGLGAGIIYDSFRDFDGIGLDSVSDSVVERRRGADVRLELELSAANVPMTVIIFHCGLFGQQ